MTLIDMVCIIIMVLVEIHVALYTQFRGISESSFEIIDKQNALHQNIKLVCILNLIFKEINHYSTLQLGF